MKAPHAVPGDASSPSGSPGTLRVGVVIPAFNAAATLGEAIASLQAQRHANWQAVVVDDGSRDDTARIAEEFATRDHRIRVVRQQNAGEAGARNTGLAALETEWVAFLDADDWVAPTWLERLVAEVAADPGRDAVHCGWARVAPDGTVIPTNYLPPEGDLFAVWAQRSAFPVHAALVRRELVQRVGGFDAQLEKSADWDLWQRVARTGARFGAVPDVLAYYRMTEGAASHQAAAMLRDGLTVLRRGHAADPRVRAAAPAHAAGRPPEGVATQAFYLLAWCAGLMLGRGEDARVLFPQLAGLTHPALDADGVADSLLDAMPLPDCLPPTEWQQLWPARSELVGRFLDDLEAAAQAPGLATRAHLALARRAALRSAAWREVIVAADARIAALDRQVGQQQEQVEQLQRDAQQHRLAELDHRQAIAELRSTIATLASERDARDASLREAGAALDGARAALEEARTALEESRARHAEAEAGRADAVARGVSERQALLQGAEFKVGDMLLNRLQLRRPVHAAHGLALRVIQWGTMLRLRWDRWRSPGNQPRVLATVCSTFPIYSQTFVHQELASLMDGGHAVRLGYSTAASQADLGGRFASLWPARRRLAQHDAIHRRSLAHFRRRMPARVEALLADLAEASGMSVDQVASHANVLEGFTFARMAEAYRPAYLHSYFFYDRSLMTLIASELLDIPRGVSCYADHMLKDYELKVVPLHLQRAAVVVATSERIKDELLALAPGVDPRRILVKPNGIDAGRFPVVERPDPRPGEPFRVVVVCRIEPKKGLIDLVEAMALLRERGVAVEAHIVGVADEWSPASVRYKEALDQRIGELGLWGTVHLEGRHDHAGILRLLHLSHLFVAPFVETAGGDKDGIPTAVLEGMATGLPVVATDAGSIPEVVSSGIHGMLVPQRNPAALAEAIASLLADGAARRTMGMQAAARVREQFDVAVCEAVLHRRIREVITPRKRP